MIFTSTISTKLLIMKNKKYIQLFIEKLFQGMDPLMHLVYHAAQIPIEPTQLVLPLAKSMSIYVYLYIYMYNNNNQ